MKKENLTPNVIKQLIQDLDEYQLIELNNIYCQLNRIDNKIVYLNNSDFYESLNWSKYRLAQAISYGSFNFNDKYLSINSYSNLISYNSFTVNNLPDFLENISLYVYNNLHEFNF